MLTRLACGAVLSSLFVTTLGCAMPSLSKSVSLKDENANQSISVTMTGEYGRKLIPIRHEIVEPTDVKQGPPIPNGYNLYNNLLFKIHSTTSDPIDSMASGPFIVSVKFANSINQQDFNRLRILTLERDELSPTYTTWIDATVRPEPDKLIYPKTSQERYEQALPNFAEKSISALVEAYICFAVVLQVDTNKPSSQPFTKIEVKTEYSSQNIKAGDKVNILVTITNQGPRPAGVVSFDFHLDHRAELLALSSTQGTQTQSIVDGRNTLVHLGAMPVGANARVNLTIEAPDYFPDNLNAPTDKNKSIVMANLITIVYKAHPNDLGGMREQIESYAEVSPK